MRTLLFYSKDLYHFAEIFIEIEIERRELIYKLYKGCSNTFCQHVKLGPSPYWDHLDQRIYWFIEEGRGGGKIVVGSRRTFGIRGVKMRGSRAIAIERERGNEGREETSVAEVKTRQKKQRGVQARGERTNNRSLH